jgi:hypothetical protein
MKSIYRQAAAGDMTMVLDIYRNDISKPIYALAAGDLLRCILIVSGCLRLSQIPKSSFSNCRN